jgi:hypothetical protein
MRILVTDSDRRVTSSTSKGDQPKWFKNGLWVKADKFGYEGLAEYVVSQLLLGSNTDRNLIVTYGRCDIVEGSHAYSGCFSRNFLLQGESLVSIQRLADSRGFDLDGLLNGQISTEEKIEHVIAFVDHVTGLNFRPYLADILALDAFTLNEDRHTNNIAVVYNAELNAYRYCPYFDNGLSLLSDTTEYPLSKPLTVNTRKVKSKPFARDFSKQSRVLTPTIRFNREYVESFMAQQAGSLGRVKDILRYQMTKHADLFV